jgi:hypothetical protein
LTYFCKLTIELKEAVQNIVHIFNRIPRKSQNNLKMPCLQDKN